MADLSFEVGTNKIQMGFFSTKRPSNEPRPSTPPLPSLLERLVTNQRFGVEIRFGCGKKGNRMKDMI